MMTDQHEPIEHPDPEEVDATERGFSVPTRDERFAIIEEQLLALRAGDHPFTQDDIAGAFVDAQLRAFGAWTLDLLGIELAPSALASAEPSPGDRCVVAQLQTMRARQHLIEALRRGASQRDDAVRQDSSDLFSDEDLREEEEELGIEPVALAPSGEEHAASRST